MEAEKSYNDYVLAHCFHEDISVLPSPNDIVHIEKNMIRTNLPIQCNLSDFPKCNCEKGAKCDNDQCQNVLCYYECGTNCPVFASCMNNRILKKKWKKCEIFLTQKKGFGLRSKEKIKKGEFVIEYVGEMFTRKDAKVSITDLKKEEFSYMLKLDKKINLFINARSYGGIAQYMNHSCDPNCQLQHWIVGKVSRAAFFATEDIECLEELTFNHD